MKKYVLVTSKSWHKKLFDDLLEYFPKNQWILISDENSFSLIELKKIKPKFIFIPHWSKIIPSEIYLNFECILFHMTDLPYGRGGSPLQNLIIKGHKKTKISAIKVSKGIDEGPIYLKAPLDLNGTAFDIFKRSSEVMYKMIIEIIENSIYPKPQKGQPTIFKRRHPKESDISDLNSIDKIYDYIRMLDCEGYPNAFIEFNNIKYEFHNVKNNNNYLEANVRIKQN